MSWVDPVLFAANQRTYVQFTRLDQLDQWWHWLVIAAVVLGLVGWVVRVYRWDGQETPRGMRFLLILLRLFAFAGLLLFFLGMEQRSEQRLVKDSRAILLVDTSLSMGLRDVETAGADRESRLADVARQFQASPLLEQLRQKHDVIVYRFDGTERPSRIAALPKHASAGSDPTEDGAARIAALKMARTIWLTAAACLALAALVLGAHLWLRRYDWDRGRYGVLVSGLALVVAVVVAAVASLRFSHVTWREIVRGRPAASDVTVTRQADSAQSAHDAAPVDWLTSLQPRGTSTRLGDTLLSVVHREQGGPVSGVAVFTDGNQNAGRPWEEAVDAASLAAIPIYTIGLGSEQSPTNARVVEVDAPARVYPGDAFRIRGYLQAAGDSSQPVRVELVQLRRRPDSQEYDETTLQEDRITLDVTGQVTPVEFELTPTEPGRQEFLLRMTPSAEDSDPRDNERRFAVTIVDRKSRVLLLAGGPTREYRFLSVLCDRDPEITVDVLLQNSREGAVQEADQVLREFPSSLEALSEYDCIVALDPDWTQLSDEQIGWLERWVAEQAGGMIVIAGPVYTPEWTTLARERRGISLIKALYPVNFYSRGLQLGRDRFESTSAVPLRFSDEARSTRVFRLDEDASDGLEPWDQFPGVFGYYPVRGIKAGTTVYARCDTGSTKEEDSPVYMASQFYGAGRVLYVGSGEMWRLRALEDSYFDAIYIHLMRYVSEGRLLRDSARGLLVVDRDRCLLGETVTVRATLVNEQFQPLEVDQVEVTLIGPDGARQTIPLLPVRDAARGGTYLGQFAAMQEGDYRLELLPAGDNPLDTLHAEVHVRIPDAELERPERNDRVLSEMAARTKGQFFRGMAEACAGQGSPALAAAMLPQDQEVYLPGTANPQFQQQWFRWLLIAICGSLFLEWFLRRWNRLA